MSKDPKEKSNFNEFYKENKIYNPQILNFYTYSLNNPLIYTDPDGENPVIVIVNLVVNAVLTIFSDIPSAGDPDDFTDISVSDHNDGKLTNNIDDAIWYSGKSKLPWHIKLGMTVYEQTLITIFGEEKDLTYNSGNGYSVYTVEEGDTLYELFGEDYNSIAEFNGLDNPDSLYVGEEIRIPVEFNQEK